MPLSTVVRHLMCIQFLDNDVVILPECKSCICGYKDSTFQGTKIIVNMRILTSVMMMVMINECVTCVLTGQQWSEAVEQKVVYPH